MSYRRLILAMMLLLTAFVLEEGKLHNQLPWSKRIVSDVCSGIVICMAARRERETGKGGGEG